MNWLLLKGIIILGWFDLFPILNVGIDLLNNAFHYCVLILQCIWAFVFLTGPGLLSQGKKEESLFVWYMTV